MITRMESHRSAEWRVVVTVPFFFARIPLRPPSKNQHASTTSFSPSSFVFEPGSAYALFFRFYLATELDGSLISGLAVSTILIILVPADFTAFPLSTALPDRVFGR